MAGHGVFGEANMTSLAESFEPIVVEDADDVGSNTSANTPLLEISEIRTSRRDLLKGLLGTTAALCAALGTGGVLRPIGAAAQSASTLTFTQPRHVILASHQVAPG